MTPISPPFVTCPAKFETGVHSGLTPVEPEYLRVESPGRLAYDIAVPLPTGNSKAGVEFPESGTVERFTLGVDPVLCK